MNKNKVLFETGFKGKHAKIEFSVVEDAVTSNIFIEMHVLEQDEKTVSKEQDGCGKMFEATNHVWIRSLGFPDLGSHTVYLRGFDTSLDNDIASYHVANKGEGISIITSYLFALSQWDKSFAEKKPGKKPVCGRKFTAMVRVGDSNCQVDFDRISDWMKYCMKDKDISKSVLIDIDTFDTVRKYGKGDGEKKMQFSK